MRQKTLPSNIHQEKVFLLLENSCRIIPFNILLAGLLSLDLFYHKLPTLQINLWFLGICFISFIRGIFCKRAEHQLHDIRNIPRILIQFFFLTLLMGSMWGSCYFIFFSRLSELQEFIVILVFGGMCAGSIASLSIYMSIYSAYVLPIYLPVIIYNYASLNVDRVILATMFLLFVLVLFIVANYYCKLVNKILALAHRKDKLISKLKFMSITDPLTKLFNRRHFQTIIKLVFRQAKHDHYPVGLVSIDIDNFKLINDQFGHHVGNQCLKHLASILKKQFREFDLFRLGGDEFASIIIGQSKERILSICQQLKLKFRKRLHALSDNTSLLDKVTLSFGIIYIPSDVTTTVEAAILAADSALYQAKEEGKNKIILKDLQ